MQTATRETAIGHALVKAGYDPAASRLAVAANNLLQRCGNDPEKAVGRFEEMLDTDRTLRRAVALEYLNARAADMRGEPLTPPVPRWNESQSIAGRRRQSEIEAASGQKPDGDVQHDDASRKDIGAPDKISAGRSVIAEQAHTRFGQSAEPRSLERLEVTAIRDTGGRFSPIPSQVQKLAAVRMASGMSSLFDSYKLQDGTSVGKVHWFELDRRIEKGTKDTALLKMIRSRGKPADNYATVEQLIAPDDLETMVKTVSELSDAA